jgi:hypothetical protein
MPLRPARKMSSLKASVNAFWKLYASGCRQMCESASSSAEA